MTFIQSKQLFIVAIVLFQIVPLPSLAAQIANKSSGNQPHHSWQQSQHAIQQKPLAIQHAASTAPSSKIDVATINNLRSRKLALPISGMNVESIKGSFYELRGSQRHEASDIMAPRNTPIHAVEDGTVAKLFTSKAGGLTIYQKDPSGRFVYYYAHLERYADNLHDGDRVRRGQVIGYVGTSGNAPRNTPHLHFAINEVTREGSIYHGPAIDPYAVFSTHTSE